MEELHVGKQSTNQTKALDNLSKRHQSIGGDELDVNTGLIKKQFYNSGLIIFNKRMAYTLL